MTKQTQSNWQSSKGTVLVEHVEGSNTIKVVRWQDMTVGEAGELLLALEEAIAVLEAEQITRLMATGTPEPMEVA